MAVALAAALPALGQNGTLDKIRQDVREGAPSAAAPSNGPDTSRPRGSSDNTEWDGDLFLAALCGAGIAASSPIWIPHAILQDDSFVSHGYFRSSPYDGGSGYIKTDGSSMQTRPFAMRLDVEYCETFDDLDRFGGHLLMEAAPRFGLSASASRLEERLSDGTWDRLQLGDCNFFYRFAQGDWGEFRAGVGFNWLNDRQDTNFGVNFNYAADLYPKPPWVLSAEIGGGTLGHAGVFHFRTTAGVIFHGVEAYTGYEYMDIGQARWNGLIGGLRFWF
jgi:hypothetical protein